MKRIVSLLLSLVMVAGMIPQRVVATENPCSHTHDDSCYTVKCAHVHGECSYVEGDPEIPCDHDCTQDAACAEKVLSCTHVHDDSCSYTEAEGNQDPEDMATPDEEIGSGTPDGTPPVLNGLTISATEVTIPGEIEVIVEASDDVSGVKYVEVRFFCESTDKYLYCHAEEVDSDGKFHATLKLDQYVESGTFVVDRVDLEDEAENFILYNRTNPERPLPESVKNLSFQVVEGEKPDGNPPVLNGVTISADTVTVPGEIEVVVDVADDVSGVKYVEVRFFCESTNKYLYCHADEVSSDGKFHATLKLDQYVESGTFVVQRIDLEDNAENYIIYNHTNPESPLPESVKSLSFQAVESENPDGEPPVLNEIAISVDSITAPGEIEVIVDAGDDVSGVRYAEVRFFCESTNKYLYCHADEVSSDGKFHAILKLDQYIESGTFVIDRVDLEDNAENYIIYNSTNPKSPLPESVKQIMLNVFNTVPDVTTSVSKSDFVDVVKSATDNAYIAADYSGDATMPKAAFEAIAGTNKTIDLISAGITWRFEGNDITEEIKDIDLKVEIQKVEDDSSASGDAIEGNLNGNPGVVMKFPENGTLPGKATIQVKVDYAMRQYLGSSEGLSVYYYNNQTGKLELIASNLKVINDTYVEFPITHCSYYVLAPTLNNGSTNDNTGTCGDNLTWEFDKKTGVLTVKGTGPMYEYADGYVDGKTTPPWADGDRDRIKRVVIEEGVTTISDAAFCGFEKIQSVSIPSTVESIGGIAFEYCYSLESVVLPDNITSIGVSAFLDCRQLSSVVIGSEIETIGGFAFGGCSSLKSITFNGDAPSFGSNPNDVFCDVTATAYYPANNPTWTSNVMQNYGGTITWVPYGNSGTCGADLTWKFNEATKVLTISGAGPMQDFTLDGTWYGTKATDTPWRDIQHKILEVVIESGVTTVGRGAFAGMEQLIVVSLPDTLTSVGDFAFHGDTSLKALNIPDGVTYLGQYSLCCCPNLVTISLPDGITEITTSLLDQTWPNNVTIPTGVTTVGSKAFAYGTISEIVFTGNAPTFAADTFYNQTTTVRYPKNNATWTDAVKQNYGGAITWLEAESSVDDTDIGEPVFTTASGTWGSNISWNLDATGLLTISGSGVMDHFSENPNMDYSAGLLYPWHSYANGITRLVVNENIEGLNANAFAGLKYLTRVTLPDSLKDMGFGAFADCISLTDVTFGSGITEIGDSAFARCTALERITIPSNVTRIGQQSFDGCKKLKDISIPEGVTVIWKQAFRGCIALTNIAFPESLGSIGTSAFEGCCGLTEVTLPKNLLTMYGHVFYNCSNLKKLYFEGNVVDFHPYALLNLTATAYYPGNNPTWTAEARKNYGGHITWVSLATSSGTCGENLTWTFDRDTGTLTISGTGLMTDWEFWGAEQEAPWDACRDMIKKIVIEDGVTTIGEDAFSYCTNLTEVRIAASVYKIGVGAFACCENLQNINIPNGVAIIRDSTFAKCHKLTDITIPETVTTIEALAFSATGIATIHIPTSVTNISPIAFGAQWCGMGDIGTGINDKLVMITVDTNNPSYTSDSQGALYTKDMTTLVRCPGGYSGVFVVPDSITKIGGDAFNHCVNVTEIRMGDGVTEIGFEAFAGCKKLSKITLSQGLTALEAGLFHDCESLREITIPANVTMLECVFNKGICECRMPLEKIVFEGNAPQFHTSSFYGITATAYYPAGNATWTNAVMQDYEGTITWEAYCPGHVFGDWVIEGNTSSRTCTLCGYTEHKVTTNSGDVEVEIPEQPDLEVEVDPVLPSEDGYVLVEEAFDRVDNEDQAILKVFDINLKNADGVHVQPNGTVKVKLPLDWEKDGNYKVYRVNDDGTLTDMNAYREGSHMVFETDHFSLYVIVEEGHQHDYQKVVTAPDCTEGGFTTYTCGCGSSYVDDEVAALGHSYDKGKVTKKPTCMAEGVKTYTCGTCGDTKTEPVEKDPKNHSFTKYESDNNATCKKNGTKTAKCDYGCGKTDTVTDRGSKLGHKYQGDKCIRCGVTRWNPDTGDKIMIAVATMAVSAVVLLVLFVWKKRK